MNQEDMLRFNAVQPGSDDIFDPPVILRESVLTAGKYETHYITAGSGKDILLLHGAGGEGTLFKEIIPLLASKYRLIIPDILGHGRTQGPRVLFHEGAYTAWLNSFISALNLDRPDIVGHSLGGAIALRFAYRYPQQVNRLVLVNSVSLGMPRLRATLDLLLAVFSPSKKMSLDLVGKVMFPDESKRKALMNRLFSEDTSVPKGVQGFLWMLSRSWWIGWPLSRRKLRSIHVPVMLLWGTVDGYFPISHAQRAHEIIPRSHLAVINDTGHAPFLERPELFARKLIAFLDQD